MLCERLRTVGDGAIKHIDLWNHNVEFIEQEDGWALPAVFVEFAPIEWRAVARNVEYRADPLVRLHIVTEWKGGSSAGSVFKEEALSVFDLSQQIHEAVCLMGGDTFQRFDLVQTATSHNHEDILENIDTYQCVAFRRFSK